MPISPIGGFIVKRYVSLLIALVLLVSMFALPTLAFAQEADTDEVEYRELGFNAGAFKEYVVAENLGFYVDMSDKFQLNQEWLKNETAVHALFDGQGDENKINYRVLPAEDEDIDDEDKAEFTVTYSLGDHAKEGTSAPASVTYKATQHVTLPAASKVEAASGYKFGGWLVPVTYDGKDSQTEHGQENLLYRAGEQFSMPAKNIEVVANWIELPAADSEEKEAEPEYFYPVDDIICLEYRTPTDDPKDENWTRVKASETISLQTSGWWMFRYVVVDGENGDVSDDDAVLTPYNDETFKNDRIVKDGSDNEIGYDWEYYCLKRWAVDNSQPEAALSSSMVTKMEDGLTAGVSYAIPTSLDITDASGTSVTYKVFRHSGDGVDKAEADGWVEIYDSKTGVVEGYEKYITSSGTLNPLSEDVTTSGNYRYKIVYSVKDNSGFFAKAKNNSLNGIVDNETGEFHPVLLLGVHLSDDDLNTKQKMEIWKIILFVIAGLSAVGIVLLFVIKPKQAVDGDARIQAANGANTNADASDNGDESSEE